MICGQEGYGGLSSCHEKNEKKRCPFCGSLQTKRKGFVKSLMKTKRGIVPKITQRYFCHECRKNFSTNAPETRKRVSDNLKADAVRDYICTKSSLSEVGKRFGVHASTVHRWVMEQAAKPRSSGSSKIIESWNRTLNRKLKNMDGFKTDESCKAFLQLWLDAQIMKESK